MGWKTWRPAPFLLDIKSYSKQKPRALWCCSQLSALLRRPGDPGNHLGHFADVLALAFAQFLPLPPVCLIFLFPEPWWFKHSAQETSFALAFRGALCVRAVLVSTVTYRLSPLPGTISCNTKGLVGKPHSSIECPLKKTRCTWFCNTSEAGGMHFTFF